MPCGWHGRAPEPMTAAETRIQTPYLVAEDELDRSLRPLRLEEFVGQDGLRDQLAVAIEAAAARGEALDHLLLAGPPGLGKTSLAQIVAAELEVPFVATAGPALERKGDIASFLTALEPRSVFFVDEIHRLARTLEETFYPAMEDHRLPITVGAGAGARVVTLELPPFTLDRRHHPHGPAEHPSARPLRHPGAPGALHRERAGGDRAPLGEASSRSRSRRRGPTRSPPAAAAPRGWPTACSSACATTPRCASTASSAPGPHAKRWRCWRWTRSAWTASIASILEAICVKFSGGPVGLSTLAVAVGEEQDTIEDVYEPYLLQQGLIKRTPRGRAATAAAFSHLGLAAPDAPRPGAFLAV